MKDKRTLSGGASYSNWPKRSLPYRPLTCGILSASLLALASGGAWAIQNCPSRPGPSGGEDIEVKDPVFIRSAGGKLQANLSLRYDAATDDANERFCIVYQDKNGQEVESPVLRVRASDEVNLHVVNQLRGVPPVDAGAPEHHHVGNWGIDNPCTPSPAFSEGSSNLHFHGLNIPPTCSVSGPWADEVISALIPPEASQDYKFSIPRNDPPGLFWYHPHVHSLSQRQVLGGMTGALIVDGVEDMHNAVLGLRERVLVLRDQELRTPPEDVRYIERPDLLPGGAEEDIVDVDGVSASARLLNGEMVKTYDESNQIVRTVMPPWKDASINGAPVVFQLSSGGTAGYSKAPVIKMEGRTEFWRVANAAADSYFRLQVLLDGKAQPVRLVAMDGIPVSTPSGHAVMEDLRNGKALLAKDGRRLHKTLSMTEILLPPGGRAEFIVDGPRTGQRAELVTRFYETNADNDPERVLAEIRPAYDRPVPVSAQVVPNVPASPGKNRERFLEAGDTVAPRGTPDHTLVFHQDDEHFYIEEKDVNGPFANRPFDMTEGPRITVRQGEIQEWRIENQAEEAHAFHIHQIHFRVLQRGPDAQSTAEKLFDKSVLRDVIELPAWDKEKYPQQPPYVVLRMYFNEKDIAGNLLYHCHILEHEDNGMMAIIKIDPPATEAKQRK